MCQQRRIRSDYGGLLGCGYPHSRHKVTLFTLWQRACGVRLELAEHDKESVLADGLRAWEISRASVVLARVT